MPPLPGLSLTRWTGHNFFFFYGNSNICTFDLLQHFVCMLLFQLPPGNLESVRFSFFREVCMQGTKTTDQKARRESDSGQSTDCRRWTCPWCSAPEMSISKMPEHMVNEHEVLATIFFWPPRDHPLMRSA